MRIIDCNVCFYKRFPKGFINLTFWPLPSAIYKGVLNLEWEYRGYLYVPRAHNGSKHFGV